MSDPAGFLLVSRREILDRAAATLGRRNTRHYQSMPEEEARKRLEALYDRLVAAAATHDLTEVLAYASRLAAERFSAGYDVSEVQTAINVLEEAVWSAVIEHVPPDELAPALGLVSTILGAAKDALAREYVALATRSHLPSLDLSALFSGRV